MKSVRICSETNKTYKGTGHQDEFMVISDQEVNSLRRVTEIESQPNHEKHIKNLTNKMIKVKQEFFPLRRKIPDPLETPVDITSIARPIFKIQILHFNLEIDFHKTENTKFLNESKHKNSFIRIKFDGIRGVLENYARLDHLLAQKKDNFPGLRMLIFVKCIQIFDRIQKSQINKLLGWFFERFFG